MNLRVHDQAKYDMFCAHLNVIDPALEDFAKSHSMSIVKNVHRQPERDLKRLGSPMQGFKKPHSELIFICTSDHWREATWTDDMAHDVGVVAYYYPEESQEISRRYVIYKRTLLCERQPFSLLREKLDNILVEGLAMLNSWAPPVISPNAPNALSDGWASARNGWTKGVNQ